jgi:hypothetical protein
MDNLEELCKQIGGKIEIQNISSANFKNKSSRRIYVNNYKQSNWRIEVDDYVDTFLVGIKVNSKFGFSINRADHIFGYNKKVVVAGAPIVMYTSDGKNPFITWGQLNFFERLSAWLNELGLTGDEMMFFYNNHVYCGLEPSRNLASIIDSFIDLLQSHEDIFLNRKIQRASQSQLPQKLQSLNSLMDQFAVSDDAERDQLISSMDEVEKEDLIAAVDPLISEIDDYLESFQQLPLSEDAIRLGNLAELVTELKLKM